MKNTTAMMRQQKQQLNEFAVDFLTFSFPQLKREEFHHSIPFTLKKVITCDLNTYIYIYNTTHTKWITNIKVKILSIAASSGSVESSTGSRREDRMYI